MGAYFDFTGNNTALAVSVRGRASGELTAYQDEALSVPVGEIRIRPSRTWTSFTGAMGFTPGKAPLYLVYRGQGRFDLKDIKFAEN